MSRETNFILDDLIDWLLSDERTSFYKKLLVKTQSNKPNALEAE